MYNGIGLLTPRGSGTSGYVQTNKFNLRHAPPNRSQNNRDDAGPTKPKADQSILEHRAKREIELKVAEEQAKLEDEGLPEDQIAEAISIFRAMLVERHSADVKEAAAQKDKLSQETHEMAKRKEEQMNKLARAFQVDTSAEGAAFNKELQEKKRQEAIEAREQREIEAAKRQRKKEREARRREKEAKRAAKEAAKQEKARQEEMERRRLEWEERQRRGGYDDPRGPRGYGGGYGGRHDDDRWRPYERDMRDRYAGERGGRRDGYDGYGRDGGGYREDRWARGRGQEPARDRYRRDEELPDRYQPQNSGSEGEQDRAAEEGKHGRAGDRNGSAREEREPPAEDTKAGRGGADRQDGQDGPPRQRSASLARRGDKRDDSSRRRAASPVKRADERDAKRSRRRSPTPSSSSSSDSDSGSSSSGSETSSSSGSGSSRSSGSDTTSSGSSSGSESEDSRDRRRDRGRGGDRKPREDGRAGGHDSKSGSDGREQRRDNGRDDRPRHSERGADRRRERSTSKDRGGRRRHDSP